MKLLGKPWRNVCSNCKCKFIKHAMTVIAVLIKMLTVAPCNLHYTGPIGEHSGHETTLAPPLVGRAYKNKTGNVIAKENEEMLK